MTTVEKDLSCNHDKHETLPNRDGSNIAMSATTADGFSLMEMVCFSSGIAAYRVIRLSIELFLVLRFEELNMKVSQAGLLYLLYCLASIFTGLFLFKFSSIFFSGKIGATVAPFASAVLMTAGFFGMFMSENFAIMIVWALSCGIGVTSWSIYFQVLTNITFTEAQLGDVTQMRQGWECLGFLLPSICLAIINSFPTVLAEDGLSIVQLSVLVLGGVAVLFHLMSFRMIKVLAVRLIHSSSGLTVGEPVKDSVWVTLKQFCGTSVFMHFLLTAILLAASSVVMGTLSLTTDVIFGIDPTFLWIAAIGFPIGGMLNFGVGAMGWKQDPKTESVCGSACLVAMFSVITTVSAFITIDDEKTAKAFLFLFGLACGIFYSATYVGALELWFQRLKDCQVSFVSQANAIDDLGNQAVIACAFQVQMIFIEQTIGNKATLRENSKVVEAMVLFGPLVGLFGLAYIVGNSLPCPKDPIFGWPTSDPFGGRFNRIAMWLMNSFGVLPISATSFAYFSDFRTGMFADGHLLNSTKVQSGPQVDSDAMVCADHLEEHLEKFNAYNTSDTWNRVSGSLDRVIFDNSAALEECLRLVTGAMSKIWIVTWAFEDSNSAYRLCDVLIEKAKAGLDVRVIVDGVNLVYLHHKQKLTRTVETEVLYKLSCGGVQVKGLETWFEEKQPSYVCGSHRKILLVDDKFLLTGGRDISDEDLSCDSFHFKDADVLLQAVSFGQNTGLLYEELWKRSKEINSRGYQDNKINMTRKSVAETKQVTTALDMMDVSGGTFVTDDFDSSEVRSYIRPRNDESETTKVAEMCELGNPLTHKHQQAPTLTVVGMTREMDKDGAGSSITAGDKELGQNFVEKFVPSSKIDRTVALFQLDHKAGNPTGRDIIFSTLLFLIETAEESIDLIFGYFQLLPGLDSAITRAIDRGVKIRLITNSDKTSDLPFYNQLFRQALSRLWAVGVEVFMPQTVQSSPTTDSDSDKNSHGADQVNYCFHYKMAIIDGKAALMGSWNCLGVSVFHNDEFSVVMFDQERDIEASSSGPGLGGVLVEPFEEAIREGSLVRVTSLPEGSFVVPFAYRVFGSNNARQQMSRGF